MSQSGEEDHQAPPPVPAPPPLPEVEQESTEDILAHAPSTEEIIQAAEPAEDVLASQPTVDELLGRDRDERA
ncbi:MAG TPA: hypothetical protein VI318_09265 [Baekduia sp.]